MISNSVLCLATSEALTHAQLREARREQSPADMHEQASIYYNLIRLKVTSGRKVWVERYKVQSPM